MGGFKKLINNIFSGGKMKEVIKHLKENVGTQIIVLLLFMLLGINSVNVVGDQLNAPKYMQDFINKFNTVYCYTTNEMVRFVEKQYTKVVEKPNDLYVTDLKYAIDIIWPAIPEERKVPSLILKYQRIKEAYDDCMTNPDNGS